MPDTDAAVVQVFTADDCGRCPAVIDLVEAATADRDLDVEILDVEDDRREALRAGVLSVPTVVAGEEQLHGVPDQELLETALETLESRERSTSDT